MNKNDIFNNYSLKKSTVDIPNWGGEIHIQELTANAMESMRKAEGSELEMAAIVVLNGVITEDGKHMFDNSDKKRILDMAPSDLVKVSTAVIELSDLGGEEEGK